MLLAGPFAMLSMPSFDSLPTMAIATLAIATVSLGGTISLCTVVVMPPVLYRLEIW